MVLLAPATLQLVVGARPLRLGDGKGGPLVEDRKSTRLNSSHGYISYAVFCLKQKRRIITTTLHALILTFTEKFTIRHTECNNVDRRVNINATTHWSKTQTGNGVHLERLASVT